MVLLAQLATYVLPKGAFEMEPAPDQGSAYEEVPGSRLLREQLTEARQARNLSPQDVAAIFHVSEDTVRGWELGPPQKGGPWTGGTQIEAHVGALLAQWVGPDRQAPGDEQIQAWKSSLDVRQRVVPGTYHTIKDEERLPAMAFLLRLLQGLMKASDIIFFVFLVGGTIGLLRATGAIDALIGRAIRGLGAKPVLLIAGITTLLAVGSSTIGMAEEYMPFVPVLVTLCLALRMDAVVAMGIIYIGAGIGYGAAAINPFTVMIAQGIAGVEPTSGWELRSAFLLVCLIVAVAYLVRYARRIQGDPTQSLVRDIDYSDGYRMPDDVRMTGGRALTLLTFLGGIVLFVIGVKSWNWYFEELSAVFLALAILSAVFCAVPPNQAAQRFCEGAAEMTSTALLIGVARTIQVLLDEGQVLATVVDGIASMLNGLGTETAAIGMLMVQSVCNFFVPSGSGQAYVTMPIMAPLADLTGVTRQTAVLCYQIGDGFMNMIVPTNALLMGMLALARVPYQRWLRFVLPLMGWLYLLAVLFILCANWMQY